jgi:single-strand DNA-binding protein
VEATVYEPTIELSGHLGSDPALRYTPNGVAVVDLRVATTPRRKVGEEWQDLETLWFTVTCWKQLAENAAASFRKGDRLMVRGRLGQQTYVRTDGSVTSKWVIDAQAVGADASRAEVTVKRPAREDAAAAAWPDKWASQLTGEVADDPAALDPSAVPLGGPFGDLEESVA